MKVLITGVAGFIGMHVAISLLKRGDEVVGVDNICDYYDVELKHDRLKEVREHANFRFLELDITDEKLVAEVFAREKFHRVVHLAAQPGVRYSLKNPHAYINCNVVGFINVLEGCRHNQVEHLVYASSSSVYGSNSKMPFSVTQNVDHPVSLYAATKKAGELMAHAYSHLYGLPCTGLRFFTVFGPWGRPDMSPSLFARAIQEGAPIDLFNHGNMQRDFTYIDDIVESVVRLLDRVATPDESYDTSSPNPSTSHAPYRVYNVGNQEPIELMRFIYAIEDAMGIKAKKNMVPMQAGDVVATYADIGDLKDAIGFIPSSSLSHSVRKFVEWYTQYYKKREPVRTLG